MAEHVQRNAVAVWAVLCGLLGLSLLGPMAGIRLLTLITAFGVALVKAYLVAKHFMHLDVERRWVAYLLLAMVALMVVMFSGIAPDVMRQGGHRWENTAARQAPAAGGAAGRGH